MEEQTESLLELERQLDHQIDLLESFGRVEVPVRGIRVGKEAWEITDIQTSEAIEVIPVQNRKIVFVLDGDHVITDDFHVFSLAEKKNTQELNEMAAFFRGKEPLPGYFASLPASEQGVYTYNQRVHCVFDTNRVVEKLLTFFTYEDAFDVWIWNGKELEKDYRHRFESTFDKVVPMPHSSQILGPNEVGFQFTRSFVVFDIETRRELRKILTGLMSSEEFFLLPDGKLALRWREERESITDVSRLLQRGNPSFVEIKNIYARELFGFPYASNSLILKNTAGEYLYLIWSTIGAWVYGKSGSKLKKLEMKGKIGDNFCGCSFHGTDVAFVRAERKQLGVKGSGGTKILEGRQVTFIDLETGKEPEASSGMELRGAKEGRALSVPGMETTPAEHLSGDRYLVELTEGKRLIQFAGEKYSLGVKSFADYLLPASKWQKKILKCYMNELFSEAKSKLAKDLENLIKEFL